jgi:hypothetical protein
MSDTPEIPEFYVDQFKINVGPYGMVITFGLAEPHLAPGQVSIHDTVRLRMSLEHMKVTAIIFKKQLKTYEETMGVKVAVPRQVLNQLGLSEEDW